VRPRQVRYQAALRPDCLDYSNDLCASLLRGLHLPGLHLETRRVRAPVGIMKSS
jgi:hypothetical protein